MNNDPSKPAPKILLALSGGGFRATLFHLGAICALRDRRILDRVDRVHSVSGGSVLGAHLVARWADFCSDPRSDGAEDAFRAAVSPLLHLIRSDVRGRVFRRWIIGLLIPILLAFAAAGWVWRRGSALEFSIRSPDGWVLLLVATLTIISLRSQRNRTRRLADEYESLFPHKEFDNRGIRRLFRKRRREFALKHLPRSPALQIMATSLTAARAAWFERSGFRMWGPSPHDPHKDKNDPGPQTIDEAANMSLAWCVAASSAFPPGFPPVRFGNWDTGGTEIRVQTLTDGGVYDNLGIRVIEGEAKTPEPDRIILVCDAGIRVGYSDVRSFVPFTSRMTRVIDVLMKRVADEDGGWARAHFPAGCVASVDLNLQIEEAALPEEYRTALTADVQSQIARIRTDLNAFSNAEVIGAYLKGYLSTKATIDATPALLSIAKAAEKPTYLPTSEEALNAELPQLHVKLAKSNRVPMAESLVSFSDLRASIVLVALGLASLFGLTTGLMAFSTAIRDYFQRPWTLPERLIGQIEPLDPQGRHKFIIDHQLLFRAVNSLAVSSNETQFWGALPPFGSALGNRPACIANVGPTARKMKSWVAFALLQHWNEDGRQRFEVLTPIGPGNDTRYRYRVPAGAIGDKLLFVGTCGRDKTGPEALEVEIEKDEL